MGLWFVVFECLDGGVVVKLGTFPFATRAHGTGVLVNCVPARICAYVCVSV